MSAVVVTPRTAGLSARVRALAARRRVLVRMVAADLKVKYERSALGYVWSVLEPLLLTSVYFFVFETIVDINIPDYGLFLIVCLLPWTWFNTSVANLTTSLTANAKLATKVYMPREIFPLASLGARTLEFVFSLLVLAIFAVVTQHAPSRYLALFPLAFALQAILLVGLSLLLSAVNTLLRDVERIVRPALRAFFYLTPIIYPLERVPERFHFWTNFNPLTGIMELYRAGWFPDDLVGWGQVASSAVGALALLAIGWTAFARLEPAVLKELG